MKKVIAVAVVLFISITLFGCSSNERLEQTLIDGSDWEMNEISEGTEAYDNSYIEFRANGMATMKTPDGDIVIEYSVEGVDTIILSTAEEAMTLSIEEQTDNEIKGTFKAEYEGKFDYDGDFMMKANRA